MQRILEAHGNVKDLPLVDAKLQYIRSWQALPDYGIALFLVKHMGHKVIMHASHRHIYNDLVLPQFTWPIAVSDYFIEEPSQRKIEGLQLEAQQI